MRAFFLADEEVIGYDQYNSSIRRKAEIEDEMGRPYVVIAPGDRLLIPTGIIFDIPEGYSIRLHPRSGLALKKGLTLCNAEGVIDSDYVEPVYAAILNQSGRAQNIYFGDRICQAEQRSAKHRNIFEVLYEKPAQKTDRDGGFGSTGTK
tara:strand:+ start:1284 stop:1730 length:447 start_codon:yes stop_codon:yes gene_type:complete